jgi:hypothetical protein
LLNCGITSLLLLELDIATGWIWTVLLAGFGHCYWLDLDEAVGSIWRLLLPIWTLLVTISEIAVGFIGKFGPTSK